MALFRHIKGTLSSQHLDICHLMNLYKEATEVHTVVVLQYTSSNLSFTQRWYCV